MKKISRGIEFKTLIFILLFNIGIILIFCISEGFIYQRLYKTYQISKLNDIVKDLQTSRKDTYILAEKLAYDNEVCISVVDNNYVAYNFNTLQVGCMLGKNNDKIDKKITKFIKENDLSEHYYLYNHDTKSNGIMYAVKINNKNVFIYSNLQHMSSFINLMKNQMWYFIALIIIVSIIVSIYLANKLTKPIREITQNAKKLGDRNYNIIFPKNGIEEIDSLSQTLEEVQKELNKNDELKRDLMANVSHDLKTPLTMIKAYAEMIRDISYKDKKQMDEHLNVIMEESDRLTLLVNDILELSKTQSEVNMYNYEEYDLIKEIKKVIKRYKLMEELNNYQFILELPKKAIVKADKNKINQVIYNLLNNAINYTGDDKIVKIKVTKDDKSYLVEIIDTGKGIKKEEIPLIWDKYYKNEKKHKRNVISTGLGLSIVKEILSKHNFEYGVTSKINKGSTFYFRINL